MADIKPAKITHRVTDEELRRGIELLYFAYRDFNSEADDVLGRHGYGRAHHRAIHFIGRNPGITVARLLEVLTVTKQSLSRVLRQLVHDGIVAPKQGTRDRRQRLLTLSEKGEALEQNLSDNQRNRLREVYKRAGSGAVVNYHRVLEALVNDRTRLTLDRREGG